MTLYFVYAFEQYCQCGFTRREWIAGIFINRDKADEFAIKYFAYEELESVGGVYIKEVTV